MADSLFLRRKLANNRLQHTRRVDRRVNTSALTNELHEAGPRCDLGTVCQCDGCAGGEGGKSRSVRFEKTVEKERRELGLGESLGRGRVGVRGGTGDPLGGCDGQARR